MCLERLYTYTTCRHTFTSYAHYHPDDVLDPATCPRKETEFYSIVGLCRACREKKAREDKKARRSEGKKIVDEESVVFERAKEMEKGGKNGRNWENNNKKEKKKKKKKNGDNGCVIM